MTETVLPPIEAQELLSRLADLHLPANVSPWPLAPFWWLLILLILCLALVLAYRVISSVLTVRSQQNYFSELDLHYEGSLSNANPAAYFQYSNRLLKILALGFSEPASAAQTSSGLASSDLASPANELTSAPAAPLTGEAWVDWLQKHSTIELSAAACKGLSLTCYQPQSTTPTAISKPTHENIKAVAENLLRIKGAKGA